MAGYVTRIKDGKPFDIEFHIGQNPLYLCPIIDEVSEIQLDGDELDHFFDNFQNFPQTRKKVQTWYGDMAKYIVRNW